MHWSLAFFFVFGVSKRSHRTRSQHLADAVQRGFGKHPNKHFEFGAAQPESKIVSWYQLTLLAGWYNAIGEIKIVSSQTVIWLCRFPKVTMRRIVQAAERACCLKKQTAGPSALSGKKAVRRGCEQSRISLSCSVHLSV